MLLPGPQCVMGPCTASHCCCLHRPHSAMCHFQVSSHCCWVPFCHRVLADYGLPDAAARPLICHGPLYRLLMLLARSTVCHGSLYTASHCCCLHRHTLPCA
ncbi:unnamed protein product, partial [Staurois parvus]